MARFSVHLSVCPFPPLGLRPGWMAQGGGTYGRTNKWTDGRKISPFYRTLSPIRAAALPSPVKTKEKVEQGKGTAVHLMPLGYLFSFRTSGPNKLAISFRQCLKVKYLISTSHGTLDCPLGTIGEPEGPWGAYKMAKKCLK